MIVLLFIQAIAHIMTVWVKENKEKENFMRDVDPYVQADEYDRFEEYDSMPFLGREFTAEEGKEQNRLAVISEEMMRREYDDICQDVIFVDGSWRAQDVTVVAIGLNPLYHKMNGEMLLKCCLWIVCNLLVAVGIGFIEMLWTNHKKKASK